MVEWGCRNYSRGLCLYSSTLRIPHSYSLFTHSHHSSIRGLDSHVGDLIVPISMISLGVDFAVHAIRRYQEESFKGNIPRHSLLLGITGIFSALSLVMISDEY